MAINRILGPSPLALTTADYEAQNNLLAAGFSGQDTVPWSGSAMQIGAVFQVGGTVYRVDTSTAITGTPSPYVRITPAGATASASFVANLSGVTWNTVFNGYYDGSGNRYLFDEALALTAGAIASSRHIASISASVLAYLRNAGNLNAGTLPDGRFPSKILNISSWQASGATIALGTISPGVHFIDLSLSNIWEYRTITFTASGPGTYRFAANGVTDGGSKAYMLLDKTSSTNTYITNSTLYGSSWSRFEFTGTGSINATFIVLRIQ